MVIAICTAASARRLEYYDPSATAALHGINKRAVLVPAARVVTSYVDNTQAAPDTVFTDSFLLAAVNTFLRFETTRRHAVLPAQLAATALPRATVLDSAMALGDSARSAAAHLADSLQADLTITVVACSTGYRVYQADAWRNNNGPGYARPIESTGFARVHLQIRDRSGAIRYECIGNATAGKPMLYGLFNGKRARARRDDAMRTDIVKASRKLYAPPIVRALGKAVANAFPVR
jgi:hypothetical protein